jgi:hypothetical protein
LNKINKNIRKTSTNITTSAHDKLTPNPIAEK